MFLPPLVLLISSLLLSSVEQPTYTNLEMVRRVLIYAANIKDIMVPAFEIWNDLSKQQQAKISAE